MSRLSGNGLSFSNEDLVLRVGPPAVAWGNRIDRYEAFIDALCGDREYQKEAIRTAITYLLGGRVTSLRQLARLNFDENPVLVERYSNWDQMQSRLQLPDVLSASLDLSTGSGKSFVMYGIAAIMLSEGVVDNVLALCPSTTIEAGLLSKFTELAARTELRDLLPVDAVIASPEVIRASESIVRGSLCVENYHAVLEHVGSSIKDSLWGKGSRTLVLNDEVHHVATEADERRRWKDFLGDQAYGFRYMIGLSGTCYVGDEYFADVIFRYSLRQAMEEQYVKMVDYVTEMPETHGPDDKWQLIRSNHERQREYLATHGLVPLTIVVTQTIARCKDVAERLEAFLVEQERVTPEDAKSRVLCVYNGAPDVKKLPTVDDSISRVEWIVAVSMLNEGWDVKRVFQIVPHEERAFNSKLLISQVLGRGLRIPDKWKGEQPSVIVFNHDSWSTRIAHLVDEVMEMENRLSASVLPDSPYHFDLHQIDYTREQTSIKKEAEKPFKLFEKGFVDLASDEVEQEVAIEMAHATTGERFTVYGRIKNPSYTARQIARAMYDRLEEAYDPEDPNPSSHYRYTDEWTQEKLESVVKESLRLRGMNVATERMRQKFLQALGTLSRGSSEYARYTPKPNDIYTVSTRERPPDSVSESDLHRDKTFYYTDSTRDHLDPRQWPCFDEVTEEESTFSNLRVQAAAFKTPLNATIADAGPEKQFFKQLRMAENQPFINAWIKNHAMSFYRIDYYWKKGEHPKSGKFSPDFFIKSEDCVLVIEIKDNDEIEAPSTENFKKYEYAKTHFDRINSHLEAAGDAMRYHFHFVTPRDFNTFFQRLRQSGIDQFQSDLDVTLATKA